MNGAFESPAPDTRLEVDNDSGDASLEQLTLADALLLGRKVYQGLAAVWPYLGDDPALGRFAERINDMPKYVASRTLTEPLDWNATLIRRAMSGRSGQPGFARPEQLARYSSTIWLLSLPETIRSSPSTSFR